MPVYRVSCLVLLLTLAACTASSGRPAGQRGAGYGPPPENASSTIAGLFGAAGPLSVSDPDPYPLRLDGRWFYGWRVCARDDATGRLGFFLFQRNNLSFHALGNHLPDSRDSVLADQHCGNRQDF